MDGPRTESKTLGQNLGSYLLKQANKFKTNIAKVRESGEIEAVHNLRVASRRLSEPLIVLEESISANGVKKIRGELRKWRQAFRCVRDLDVIGGETFEEVSSSGNRVILDGLNEELARQREKKINAAIEQGEDLHLKRILKEIRDLSKEIEPEAISYRIGSALSELYDRRAATIRELKVSHDEAADLHPARIAVKKMRYCAELVKKVGIRDEAGLIEELTALQTILGRWNDQMIAIRWLGKFAARRGHLVSQSGLCREALRAAEIILQSTFSDRKRVEQRWPALIDALDQSGEAGNGLHQPAMLARG